VLPDVRSCAANSLPDGWYCAFDAKESGDRAANRTAGLPVNNCARLVYQCSAGETKPVRAAPEGYYCVEDVLVRADEARCFEPVPTAKPTAAPILKSCFGETDGLYCAADKFEAAARLNASAFGVPVSECYDSSYACEAGSSKPVTPVGAGMKCYRGSVVPASDARCSTAKPAAAETCGCAGLACCTAQCSSTFYTCCGGVRSGNMTVPAGTKCVDQGAGAVFVGEDASTCVASGQTCGAGETSVRCYSAPGDTAACASSYYQCSAGRALGLQTVEPGLACYNGNLIASNNVACTGTAAPINKPNTTIVTLAITAEGTPEGQLNESFFAVMRAIIRQWLFDNGITDLSVDDIAAGLDSSSDARRRLLAAAPVAVKRQMRRGAAVVQAASAETLAAAAGFCPVRRLADVLADAGADAPPPATGFASVAVVSAAEVVGELGAGSSAITMTVAVPPGVSATLVAQLMSQLMTTNSSTGSAIMAARLAAAGYTVAIASVDSSNVGVVAGPSPAPTPAAAAAGQSWPVGAIVGGVLGAAAAVVVAMAVFLVYVRPHSEQRVERIGEAPAPGAELLTSPTAGSVAGVPFTPSAATTVLPSPVSGPATVVDGGVAVSGSTSARGGATAGAAGSDLDAIVPEWTSVQKSDV
jgi:hypothetical protein